jgi:hypothetical protein
MTGYSVARTYLQIYRVLTEALIEGWSDKELRELAMELTRVAVNS